MKDFFVARIYENKSNGQRMLLIPKRETGYETGTYCVVREVKG